MSDYVKKKFENIIRQYQPSYISDLIVQSHCKVIYENLDNDTGGCTVTSNRCHTIIINENWEEPQQQFVLLHEFSHIKLHKGISTPFFRTLSLDHFVSQTEREANEMAIRLLLYLNRENLVGLTKYQVLDYLGLPYKFERFLSVEY